jgi:ribosomal protein S18 acetylase RimI-like enzyme
VTIKIRPMVSDDRTAIMNILHATPEFTPAEVEVAGELIDLYLQHGADSGYYIRVAEVDRALSGYICYGPAPLTEGTWDIYWIAVAPDRQGRGTGHALMAEAEAEISKARGRLILIETSSKAGYEKARNFYKSRNYELIACIPDFYTPGDDKLVLQRRLK